jgi:hypothetical protein
MTQRTQTQRSQSLLTGGTSSRRNKDAFADSDDDVLIEEDEEEDVKPVATRGSSKPVLKPVQASGKKHRIEYMDDDEDSNDFSENKFPSSKKSKTAGANNSKDYDSSYGGEKPSAYSIFKTKK